MKEFKSIVKNVNKFSKRITLAKGILLDNNQKSNRDGETGITSESFGKFWFNTPKGQAIFKMTEPLDLFSDMANVKYLNEIICYNLALKMGIDCAEYEPATLNTKDGGSGVVSYNVLKDGEEIMSLEKITSKLKCFYDESEMTFKKLNDVLKKLALREGYILDTEQIFTGLYQMIVFDFITGQSDRAFRNVNFIIDKEGILKLSPLIDNEFAFFGLSLDRLRRFESMEDLVAKEYELQAPLIAPSCYIYGMEAYDEVLRQIVHFAKKNEYIASELERMVKNASLDEVLLELENSGYKIGEDYREYISQVFDFNMKNLKREIQKELVDKTSKPTKTQNDNVAKNNDLNKNKKGQKFVKLRHFFRRIKSEEKER